MNRVLCVNLGTSLGMLIVLAVFVLGSAAVSAAGPVALLADAPPVEGEAVPAAKLRGRPVVVTFFASWCPPCSDEFHALNTVRSHYKRDNVTIVAVNVFEKFGGKENPERMKRFLDRTKPAFYLVKGDEAIKQAFGDVDRIPTLIVYKGDGEEHWRFVHKRGAKKQSVTSEEILSVLSQLIRPDA